MMVARGGRLLLLGLTRYNIERLLAGSPMSIKRESHGEAIPEGMTIGIMFGETEAELKRILEQNGALAPDAKISGFPDSEAK